MAETKKTWGAGKLIISAFVGAIVVLIVLFAVNYGGLMPGDNAVLPPKDVSILPGEQN